MKTKWLAYFQDVQKEQALRGQTIEHNVEYGDIIYRSSEFLDRRWLVANYGAEYNVFVEHHDRSSANHFDRILAATFATKERAVGFAAEMFLICCGRLHRGNRRHLLLSGEDAIKFNGSCRIL